MANATDAPASGDRWIRRGTAAAVLFVAAIAAIISFIHIRDLAATHGQTRLAAVLLPFSIDGTVVASSLVLLRAARLRLAAPWLAQVMLLSSVLATLAANVAYGAASGVTGALISGWPAYAFIGCAEMSILMVRRTARPGAPAVSDAVSARPSREYKAPVQRKLMDELGVGQDKARRVQRLLVSEVKAASNGGASHE
jgi:hypothetical protein